MSILTKNQRIEIYRRAREIYSKDWEMIGTGYKVVGGKACLGLCQVIRKAAYQLGYKVWYHELNAKNFPEWFSYKPKTGWKQYSDFWWTVSVKRGGLAKRLDLLTRLAEGKSKGE